MATANPQQHRPRQLPSLARPTVPELLNNPHARMVSRASGVNAVDSLTPARPAVSPVLTAGNRTRTTTNASTARARLDGTVTRSLPRRHP